MIVTVSVGSTNTVSVATGDEVAGLVEREMAAVEENLVEENGCPKVGAILCGILSAFGVQQSRLRPQHNIFELGVPS